jgi:hypothetical protein
MHYLLPLFHWAGDTWIARLVSGSNWMFPAIEAVHIVALAMLLGAVIMLDLRLFGVTMSSKSVSELARDLAPWTWYSLLMILLTGVMLFSSEAMKSYTSVPFRVKMVLLAAALLFHFTIYRRVTRADDTKSSHRWDKVVACVSLLLWLGVGFAGRSIGFL